MSISFSQDVCYTVTKLISVYDGDTFKANINSKDIWFGTNMSIRIKGIDTPEMTSKIVTEKAMAVEARRVVDSLLTAAETIYLTDCTKDKYFRVDADVAVSIRVSPRKKYLIDVGAFLIDRGLAHSYDGGTKTSF